MILAVATDKYLQRSFRIKESTEFSIRAAAVLLGITYSAVIDNAVSCYIRSNRLDRELGQRLTDAAFPSEPEEPPSWKETA